MLDTNIWRYFVDAQQEQKLVDLTSSGKAVIQISPATVNETLQLRDQRLMTKIVRLQTKPCFERFLTNNAVVLSVHDSFIVPVRHRDMLLQAMKDAWVFVTEQTAIKYKQNVPIYQDAVAWRNLDRDFYLERISELKKVERTTGYLNRLNKHNKFFNPKSTKSKSVQYTPDEIVMPKQYKKYQK